LFALVLAVSLMVVPAASVGASPGPGLVGLWHLDEGSGQTAGDATGVNDGQLGSTAGIDANDPTWVSPGKFGKALRFDGVDDYVQVADDDTLDITTAITIEAWVYMVSAPSNMRIVCKPYSTTAWTDPYADYELVVLEETGWEEYPGRAVYFGLTLGGSWTYLATTGTNMVPLNTWTHLAATYNGSAMAIYINGQQKVSNLASGAIASSGQPLFIGSRTPAPNEVFSGIIDEVRIWDEARTASQIAQGYAALHVDDNWLEWPGAYRTITEALAVANPGDTIIVHAGTYDGFDANVDGITVRAASKPVISGTGISFGGQVVGILVTADDVTIQGFKITGQYSTGIWVVDGTDDAQILGNTVDQTGFDPAALSGVTWDGSAIQSHGDDTVISNNRVKFGQSSRPHNGINVFYNDYIITKNTVTIFEMRKYQVGINVRAPATVDNNRVVCPDKTVGSWTRVFGIWLYGLDSYSPDELEATVTKNTVTKTDYAIWLSGSKWDSDTVIEKNTLVNIGFGIVRENGADPTIQNNRIKNYWWADIY